MTAKDMKLHKVSCSTGHLDARKPILGGSVVSESNPRIQPRGNRSFL